MSPTVEPPQSEGAGPSAYLRAVAEHIGRNRPAHDPTHPVEILVDSATAAVLLQDALARSGDPRLALGVRVLAPVDAAAQVLGASGPRLAEPAAVAGAVRAAAASTPPFDSIVGRAGVTTSLVSAVRTWTMADPAAQHHLLAAALPGVAQRRLAAVATLASRVQLALQEQGLALPSTLLARAAVAVARWAPVRPAIRIASVLSAAPGPESAFVAAWKAAGDAESIAPGTGREPGLTEIWSAVEPDQEAELVARLISAKVAHGVAPRDIVVAVPDSVLVRYARSLSDCLAAAEVPASRLSTDLVCEPAGRLVATLADIVPDLTGPRAVRADHVLAVSAFLAEGTLRAGRPPEGEQATPRDVARALLGTEPATWPDRARAHPGAGERCAIAATALNGLVGAASTERPATDWSQLLTGLFVRARGGRARQTVLAALAAWSGRGSPLTWAEVEEALRRSLRPRVQLHGEGVRILPLSAAWAACAPNVVLMGMSDDLVPGDPGQIGPLAPDEAEVLRRCGPEHLATGAVPEDDRLREAVDCLLGAASAIATYARSDGRANVERQPSRVLGSLREKTPNRRLGHLQAAAHAAAAGSLGLLGREDTLFVHTAAGLPAPWTDAAVQSAADCSRVRSGLLTSAGAASFSGHLPIAAEHAPHLLRLDHRPGSAAQHYASPSSLGTALGCPAGWWGQRVIGVREPEDLDPPEMDAMVWGSWLHAALELLAGRGLLASLPDDGFIQQALLDVLGGPHPAPDPKFPADAPDDGLRGFRLRIDASSLDRAVRDVGTMATNALSVVTALGGSTATLTEQPIDITELALPLGPIRVGGRPDRVDDVQRGFVVSDYKTGAAGDGFQLAVYAWAHLLAGRSGPARIAYITPRPNTARLQRLVDEELGLDDEAFTVEQLQAYLIRRLAPVQELVHGGRVPSWAGTNDHSRYCLVCSDVGEPPAGIKSNLVGDRAVALAAAAAPTPAPTAKEGS